MVRSTISLWTDAKQARALNLTIFSTTVLLLATVLKCVWLWVIFIYLFIFIHIGGRWMTVFEVTS